MTVLLTSPWLDSFSFPLWSLYGVSEECVLVRLPVCLSFFLSAGVGGWVGHGTCSCW